MKAVLTDEQVLVYSSTENQSISIATIHKGEVMDLGKVIRKKGKVWVEIALLGNQKGYISGETKIFSIRKGQVTTNSADLVETPVKSAAVIKTLQRGAILTISGVEKTEEGSWFKAMDDSGVNGYIATSVKLKMVPEYSRSSAIKNMITGLVFILIGVGLTVLNLQSQQANGMIYLSYAVIFFGLLQGGQGLIEFLKAQKAPTQQKK
jgi:hypothetical protein